MSFSIILQKNFSAPIKLDKTTTTITTVTGTLKDDTSVVDPVIRIQCSLSDVTGCNYMTISSFGRSYFVKDIRSLTNDIVEFTCHVDVLSTYKAGIRSNSGIIKRQQNLWNLYLNDGSLKVYQNPTVITKAFPSGFTTQEFVLAVAGS